jgi:hypothetical protein
MAQTSSAAPFEIRTPHSGLPMFLLLPAVAMSLGWGLRGTIGGGPIGAMIPGAMVMLSLCHLLGWSRSLGIVAAIGTVGVGLGGQETYGQTIGFLRDSETVLWGLTGLTIKGTMWGLSGGVLVGLGLMHAKYRSHEIANGLLLMIAATVLGWFFIDQPKLTYFSNRLDKPREEVWVGLTVGALALIAYLVLLRREKISTMFAWGGALAGGAGFGGGSLFLALGFQLDAPYSAWPWWKMMEFTFGALYGLGLGAVCYRLRQVLCDVDLERDDRGSKIEEGRSKEVKDQRFPTRSPSFLSPEFRIPNPESSLRDLSDRAPLAVSIAAGLVVAVGGLWLNFSIPFRASFSVVAAGLILLALTSHRLGWHIALSMTTCGFVRDFIHRQAELGQLDRSYDSWPFVVVVSLPVVAAVALADQKGRLSPVVALLSLTWIGTIFGLLKVGVPVEGKPPHLFVPAVFVVEAIATTALVLIESARKRQNAA